MIHFSCPNCRAGLKIAEDKIGRRLRCPTCGKTFEAPEPVPSATPAATDYVPFDTWEATPTERKTGFLFLTLGILLACAFLIMIVVVARNNSPVVARSRDAAAPPTTVQQERYPPEEPSTAPVCRSVPRKPTTPINQPRETDTGQPAQLNRPAERTEPPQSLKSPPTSPETEKIDVPGTLLKELVPGYETRRIQGFTMLLSTQAIKEAKKQRGKPFEALLVEFDGLIEVLPQNALDALRRVLIWIEWDNIDRSNPNVLAKYYGGAIWMRDPSEHRLKSNAVELLSLKKLAEEKNLSLDRTRLVLLHELAHAVHHLLVGFDNRDVNFAYKQAMDRRLYDKVQTDRGGLERAYAATNSREYFAELTCSYLDRCHYFPFTRDDLKDHDPTGYRVMEGIWGKTSRRGGQASAHEESNRSAPNDPLRGMLERYIRSDNPSKSLRIEHWHQPVRAATSQKEGLLYRVEFSIAIVNLGEGRMDRRSSNYYLFVADNDIVAKQIAPSGWGAVKICRILENTPQ
jgi:predicted Zn finger-like uncharacterized protein